MLIYIAGPLSSHDDNRHCWDGVRDAVLAAERLVARGHAVYVPHLTVLWDIISPHGRDRSFWLERIDLPILARCDALLRLPGASDGADEEVRFAFKHGLRVFGSIEEVPLG